jgi:transposase
MILLKNLWLQFVGAKTANRIGFGSLSALGLSLDLSAKPPARSQSHASLESRHLEEATVSLPAFSTQAELFSTAGLSSSLFAQTDRYRIFAQVIYPVIAGTRGALAKCYCADNGRVAVEPVLLLAVSLLQELDGAPDRLAVDMLRYHAGWNFALNRQLGDELFHHTTLCNFRQRLIEHDQSALGFQSVLDALVTAGLVSRQSRQRLDSTQMFGRVSRMSRLDCVRESLRLALLELEASLPQPARPAFWPELWERYAESQADYRASSEALARKLVQAGADSLRLLEWTRSQPEKTFEPGPQLALLERVFKEQFEVIENQALPRGKGKVETGSVQNPHDPEATYAVKGRGPNKKEHVGYKVQVAETVTQARLTPGEPTGNFLTGIVTHPAHQSDLAGAQKMEAEQEAMGMEKPPVQYVDSAYVTAEKLVETQSQGRVLMGPVQAAPPNKDGRYTTEEFDIRVEERQATCPAGRQSARCIRQEATENHRMSYRFEWDAACADCPLREQCVGKDQKHRILEVGQHHSALQARRQEQKTEAFAVEMKHRNGIEGTQSELVRGHGMRRARYRGLAKARLQNYFIGAACNVKRWINRKVWEMARAGQGTAFATG